LSLTGIPSSPQSPPPTPFFFFFFASLLIFRPWDFRNFLHKECHGKDLKKASYFDEWVNIRWLYGTCYQTKRRNIATMLKSLGLQFDGMLSLLSLLFLSAFAFLFVCFLISVGRQHSGFDDAYNVARIAQKMINDGFALRINDSLANPIDGNAVDSFYVKYKGLQNPNNTNTTNASTTTNNTNDIAIAIKSDDSNNNFDKS
jgi:hypothetical protein